MDSWPLSRCMKPRILPAMYSRLHPFSKSRQSCIVCVYVWKVLVGEVTGGGDLSLGRAESLLGGDLRQAPGGDAKALGG